MEEEARAAPQARTDLGSISDQSGTPEAGMWPPLRSAVLRQEVLAATLGWFL